MGARSMRRAGQVRPAGRHRTDTEGTCRRRAAPRQGTARGLPSSALRERVRRVCAAPAVHRREERSLASADEKHQAPRRVRVPPGRSADLAKRDPDSRLVRRQEAGSARLPSSSPSSGCSKTACGPKRAARFCSCSRDSTPPQGRTISHVLTGLNPQGCRVHSSRSQPAPSSPRLPLADHAACPEHGESGSSTARLRGHRHRR